MTHAVLAIRGPGYPLFLAGIFRVSGVDAWNVRYVQAALGALTCALIALLAAQLGGRLAGGIAGVISAIHPTLILFSGRMLTEVVATFWVALGLLAMLRGIRLRSPGWLALAGFSISFAALTRPTLISVIPFFALSAYLGTGALNRIARFRLVLFHVLPLAIPLLAWNLISQFLEVESISGSSGLDVMDRVIRTATLPEYRGWRTDNIGLTDIKLTDFAAGWDAILRDGGQVFIPAVLNLAFYHQWFLENLWREVPMWMHGIQRALFIAALGGFGLSFRDWRKFSPLTLCLIPLAVVSVKWIEIRPNLPFIPIVIVLASIFLAEAVKSIRRSHARTKFPRLLAMCCLATAAGLALSQTPFLVRTLSMVDAKTLGRIGDGVVIALAVLWGLVLYKFLSETESRSRAIASAAVPTLIFVFAFGSYAHIRSEPRHLAWSVDLGASQMRATHTITLPVALGEGDAFEATWLVDLATNNDRPPIDLYQDGQPLASTNYKWRRLFCNPRTTEASSRGHCREYRHGVSRFTDKFSSSPQWWGVAIEPNLITGKKTVSLTLRASPLGPNQTSSVVLGGSHGCEKPGACYGPSPEAWTAGAATSLYRWHVANDWRLWRTSKLESISARSEISPEATSLPSQQRALSWLIPRIQRSEATFNIRLMVKDTKNHTTFY